MDIDTAKTRQVQNILAKDLAESRHDDQVRVPGPQLLHRLRLAQLFRLHDRDAQLKRQRLDRRRLALTPAARSAVRLGDNTDQVIRPGQCTQGRQ